MNVRPSQFTVPIGTLLATQGLCAQEIMFDEPVVQASGSVDDIVQIDIDRDGDRDFVSSKPGRYALHLNDGHANFQGNLSLLAFDPDHGPNALLAGDVDGDRQPDIIGHFGGRYDVGLIETVLMRGASDPIQLLSDPVFGAAPPAAVLDLEGDGDLDHVTGSRTRVNIFRRNASGYLELEQSIFPGGYIPDGGLVTGDFDLDGDDDIAFITNEYDYWGEGNLELMYNLGSGHSFQRVTHPIELYTWRDCCAELLTAGDLDGDGDIDFGISIRAVQTDSILVPVWNEPNGFAEGNPITIPGARYGFALELADLDVDGDLDIIAWFSNRGLVTLQNLDRAGFDEPVRWFFDWGDRLEVADLNGDGLWDIAAAAGTLQTSLNVTEIYNPILSIDALVGGETSQLVISGAQPREVVDVYYTLDGAGHTVGLSPYGGMVLDLNGDFQLAARIRVDGSGNAATEFAVPSSLVGHELVAQAAIRRGFRGLTSVKTPFVTRVVQ